MEQLSLLNFKVIVTRIDDEHLEAEMVLQDAWDEDTLPFEEAQNLLRHVYRFGCELPYIKALPIGEMVALKREWVI